MIVPRASLLSSPHSLLLLLLLLLLLVPSPCAFADVSLPSPARRSHAGLASPSAQHRFNVDGVSFDVSAGVSRARRLKLAIVARSADGAEHFMASDMLELSGTTECRDDKGDVNGSGFGEGFGGSDGWDSGTRIAPGAPAQMTRVVGDAVPRGCTLTTELTLPSFTRSDGKSAPLNLAQVVLEMPAHGRAQVSIAGAERAGD